MARAEQAARHDQRPAATAMLLVRQCCRSVSQLDRCLLASSSCAARGPLYCWHDTSSLLMSAVSAAAGGREGAV